MDEFNEAARVEARALCEAIHPLWCPEIMRPLRAALDALEEAEAEAAELYRRNSALRKRLREQIVREMQAAEAAERERAAERADWQAVYERIRGELAKSVSGWEAAEREKNELRLALDSRNEERKEWWRLVNDAERAIGMDSVAVDPSARSLVEWCDLARRERDELRAESERLKADRIIGDAVWEPARKASEQARP